MSVIFYAAGTPHGLRNRGEKEVRYLVWEFHGDAAGLPLSKNVKSLLRILRKHGLKVLCLKVFRKVRGRILRVMGFSAKGPTVRLR